MTHLIYDELRRQFEDGEIDRAYYEAERATRPPPAERICAVCGRRPAFVIERGVDCCAVCALKRRTQRRAW